MLAPRAAASTAPPRPKRSALRPAPRRGRSGSWSVPVIAAAQMIAEKFKVVVGDVLHEMQHGRRAITAGIEGMVHDRGDLLLATDARRVPGGALHFLRGDQRLALQVAQYRGDRGVGQVVAQVADDVADGTRPVVPQHVHDLRFKRAEPRWLSGSGVARFHGSSMPRSQLCCLVDYPA